MDDENDRQIQMSSVSEEVFDQLIPIHTMYEIIDDTNISFTFIKYDFSIRRKALVKLYAWNFFEPKNKAGLVDVFHKNKQFSLENSS